MAGLIDALIEAIPKGVRRRMPPPVRRLRVLSLYLGRAARRPRLALRYLATGTETSNFTYAISNSDELAEFLAVQFGAEVEQTTRLIAELEHDDRLRGELDSALRARKGATSSAKYGRRLGWYAIVRLLKPDLVVETGVHDGLGSSALLAALDRNDAEGAPGQLMAIDIDPAAGWLIPDRLRGRLELVIADSLSTLGSLPPNTVGVFLHDSDHSEAHQAAEYAAVEPALIAKGVILADDAHDVPALSDFSSHRRRRHAVWMERTDDHFFGGSSLAVSLPAPPAQG